MYTGQQIFADLKRMTSESISDAINPAIGNTLLSRALYETIEDNYKNLAVQKNKDELGSLIKTRRVFAVYNSGINVNRLPITAVIIPSANAYRITFNRPHHLGAGVTLRFFDVQGVTGLTSPLFTFSATFPSNNQYSIFNENTITVGVTGASGVWVSATGYMQSSNMITDYLHLMMAKVTMEKRTKYTLSTNPSGFPLLCSVGQVNNLRTGESIKFFNPLSLTSTPRYYIMKKLKNTFRLYSDKDLNTGVGTTIATAGQIVLRVAENVCLVMNSDEKKTIYEPNENNPLVETSNKELIFYPTELNTTSVTVDYIANPTELINVESTTDYEMFYNRTFLDKVVNRAIRNAAIMFQSGQDFELITANINQNTNAIS